MKKVLRIMFTFFLFFICVISVKAGKYTCAYEGELPKGCSGSMKEVEFSFTVDEEENELVYEPKILGAEIYYLDDEINEDYTESYVIEQYGGFCPSRVYACYAKYIKSDGGASGGFDVIVSLIAQQHAIGVIFNPETKNEMKDSVKSSNGKGDSITYKKDKCYTGYYVSSKSDRNTVDTPFECKFYDDYMGDDGYLKKNYCKLGDGGCTTDKIVEYKRKKEELVATCRQYLQNGDYWDQCVKKCITLPDDIASIEGKKATNPCGFSGKLFYWIQNIMKWIKYILPVIVIIFGILDFIKAMANESDEEMKKSQKRFVIRLISAALVFLVPLIIQFVLEKMGFNANACGLW